MATGSGDNSRRGLGGGSASVSVASGSVVTVCVLLALAVFAASNAGLCMVVGGSGHAILLCVIVASICV